MKAAAGTDLAKADRLVTSGPYAVCRNPMYVGWWMLQAGIGVAAGSTWILTTVPVVAAAVHRDVVREERRLTERFGDEYLEYCAAVGRYVPKNRYIRTK